MHKHIMTFERHALPLVAYQGQRVVTFEMIDSVHQRKKDTAKRTWLAHRECFIESEDYFQLTRNVIRTGFPSEDDA